MKRVVINAQYGGFSISPLATKRIAELQGRRCYFFVNPVTPKVDLDKRIPATLKEAEKSILWYAFDIPNPDEVLSTQENWHEMTDGEKTAYNKLYQQHSINYREFVRTDPLLLQVVEELGKRANGRCATLKVVEIPDGVEWTIEEYDGNEWVAETHRTWS